MYASQHAQGYFSVGKAYYTQTFHKPHSYHKLTSKVQYPVHKEINSRESKANQNVVSLYNVYDFDCTVHNYSLAGHLFSVFGFSCVSEVQ